MKPSRVGMVLGVTLVTVLFARQIGIAGPGDQAPGSTTAGVPGVVLDAGKAKAAPGYSMRDAGDSVLVFGPGADAPMARVSCSNPCNGIRCAKHYDDDNGLSCLPSCCDMTITSLTLARATDGDHGSYRVDGKVLVPARGYSLKPLGRNPGALTVQSAEGEEDAPTTPRAFCSCGEGYSTVGCGWIERSDGSSECGGTKECCDVYVVHEKPQTISPP